MQHQEFESPSALRDSIACFWYTKIDCGNALSNFEVAPDGFAEIIFYFGSTLSISHNQKNTPLPSPFIVGLLNQPVVFESQNVLEIIGIRCFPWTVFDLLGLPSGKDGIRILEHPIARLQPLLQDMIAVGKRDDTITFLKNYFQKEQMPITVDRTLSKAGTAMSITNGNMPVSQVAAAAHSTIRTLERKFKHSSGYTVKDVSALMRFEQVRNQLWLQPEVTIAGLAHELGYTDQSHLSREFKRYSGTTPAAFARKAKAWRKAVGDDFVAFVLS